MWIIPSQLDEIIDRTLHEDMGSGDVTTNATVLPETQASAVAVARGPLVVCGGDVFARVFARIESSVRFESLVPDGTRVGKGAKIWKVDGSARALLMGERSALNLTQRMSGVATLAHTFAELVAGTGARIVDTRKTTPGLRTLERYAVRCGGAFNHRDNLSSAVLIKDNHIIAAGGITSAIERARAHAPHTSRIEVEVQTLDELDEALAAKADVILIDNFALETLREAVTRGKGKAILEASGGVNLSTVRAIAETGVDVISVGALTHSAPAADIALDLTLN
ncbi:MAG: carboxylating nicotinate-nucleotide diphosphorylase [Polyangiaceae bacterium]